MKDYVLYNNIITFPGIRFHFDRPRIDKLLTQAVSHPLVTVAAGAGYGKTQSVLAFLNHNDINYSWLHLSKLDNLTARFWESFVHAISIQDPDLAVQLFPTGFPHSVTLFYEFLHKFKNSLLARGKFVMVFDDFYLIKESSIIHFIENLLYSRLNNLTIVLITRTKLSLDIKGLITDSLLFQITEDALCFTAEETYGYFKAQGIALAEEELAEIHLKTEGWISALYLLGLSLKKERKIEHALAKAKIPIFELIIQEIFSTYSPEMQKILIKLSFWEEIPLQIFKDIHNGNLNLAEEMEKNNMFIRHDPGAQVFRIHTLFLDFLTEMQFQLTEKEVMDTHRKIADWHSDNGSKIDAIEHYQKCDCHEKIWDIISTYDISMPRDTADMFLTILEKFPKEFAENHPMISVVHARLLFNNGKLEECMREFTSIINKYQPLPLTAENKAIIGESFLFTGMLKILSYDYGFIESFKKADQYLPDGSSLIDNRMGFIKGSFMLPIKESSSGELDKHLKAVMEAMPYAARAMNGCAYGVEYVTSAEAAYYRSNLRQAATNAHKAIFMSEQKRQYDTMCAAYFILIKVHLSEGDYSEMANCLKQLIEKIEGASPEDYVYIKNCIYTKGILIGWYYSRVGDLKKIPDWILKNYVKEMILSPDNYMNPFIHAYVLLSTKKYHRLAALLDILETHYDANGLLPARLNVQIYRAVAAHKNKDIKLSMTALQKAYDLAYANSFITPFTELGKDMRAVIYNAKQYEGIKIPDAWLDNIYTKSSTYAKCLNNVRKQYQNIHGLAEENQCDFTEREKTILKYLCKGLTRKEIADNLHISTSAVKQSLSSIYNKLGVENRSEAIRIAVKRGLDK